MRPILFFLVVLLPFWLAGQQPANRPKMLLTDLQIQIQSTEAVNAMYNFKFDMADVQYRWLKYKYPSHPLGYFLLGLSEWWKIMTNVDDTRYDDKFLAYMDSSIYFAEKMHYQDKTNPEPVFFLAGAYGFKGRLHSDRSNWRRAAVAGKAALEYMQKARAINSSDFGPEFLFGEALFNYYSVWIPENYRMLRPVMAFFPKGSKEKGIKQLQEVSNNAFYTRVEAQYFLMRIYNSEEENPAMAYPIASYLDSTFPDNAFFTRYRAQLAYKTGRWPEAEKTSLKILDRVAAKQTGYEAVSGRYASFILGHIYYARNEKDPRAKRYLTQCKTFGEETGSEESGYYLYSVAYLARIALAEGDKELAKKYYETVEEYAERKSINHKEAKDFLRKYRKEHRKFWFF